MPNDRRLGLVLFVIAAALAMGSTPAEADEVADLLETVRGTDPAAASAALDLLEQFPPTRVVPAALDALAALPDGLHPQLVHGDSASRLVRVLSDAEKRTDVRTLDQMLLDAWPRARNRVTKFVLLFRYGMRGISDGEPMALATLRDPRAGAWLRRYGAAALVRLNWPQHRHDVLTTLDAEPDAGMQIFAALMDPAAAREPDPVVIALAVERVQSWADDPAKTQGRANWHIGWAATVESTTGCRHHAKAVARPRACDEPERGGKGVRATLPELVGEEQAPIRARTQSCPRALARASGDAANNSTVNERT